MHPGTNDPSNYKHGGGGVETEKKVSRYTQGDFRRRTKTKLKPEVAFVFLVPIAVEKGVKMAIGRQNKHIHDTIIEPPFVYWRVVQ